MGNFFTDAWKEIKREATDFAGGIGDVYENVFDPTGALGLNDNPWIDQAWSAIKHWLVPDMRRDREVTTTSSITARRIIYGTAKVGGQLAYVESCGDNNKDLHCIFVFQSAASSGFGDIYLDDKLITDAAFTDKVTYEMFDGTQTTACASLVAASAGIWTDKHIGYGLTYGYFKFTWDETAFPSGLPTPKVVIHGKPVFDPRTGMTAVSSNPIINIYDYIRLAKHLGGGGFDASEFNLDSVKANATICDQVVSTPDGNEARYTLNGLISLDRTPAKIVEEMIASCAGQALYSDGLWTLIAGSYTSPVATLDESWLNGGITFNIGNDKNNKTNVVKGTFVDPADAYAEKTYPPVPIGNAPPNATYWTALTCPVYVAANTYVTNDYVTHANVAYKASQNVPINTTPPNATYWDVVEEYDPDLQYPINYIVQRAGLVYQALSIVPVNNPYLAEDQNEELLGTLNLPFTTSPHTAQRLANIKLKKSRLGTSVSYPCNLKAFKLQPMDVVAVNNTLLGWSGKIFRILNYSANNGKVNLSLGEDDSAIWSDNTTKSLVYPPATNLPNARFVFPPSSLTLTPVVYDYNSGASTRVDLKLTWVAGGPSTNLQYEIQYRILYANYNATLTYNTTDKVLGSDNITYVAITNVPVNTPPPNNTYWAVAEYWAAQPLTNNLDYVIPTLASATYQIRIRAVNSINAKSDWLVGSQFVPLADTTVPNVTGLEIFNQGNDGTFVGKDVVLRWHKVNPRANVTAYGPAGEMKPDTWFRYYELEVRDSADNLLRTEYLQTESYSYTYEKNYADNTGSPTRNLKTRIRAIPTWGTPGAWSAYLTCNNPAPAAVSVSAIAGLKSFTVTVAPSPDIDVEGYLIYASQTSGFTPGSGNLISQGNNNQVFKSVSSGGTWYIKAAAYDTFGMDSLNFSTETSVTINDAQILPDDLYTGLRTDFLVDGSRFYFGDDGKAPTAGTETTLYWTSGSIIRNDATFTLSSGSIATANNCWIIATLSTGTATLSKVAKGTALPSLANNQVIIAYTSATANSAGNYICYVRQANSVQYEGANIRDLTVKNAAIDTVTASKVTSGTVTSQTVILALTEGAGDVAIRAGKSDFSDSTSGFILGIDDSDSNKPKFEIGNSTNYLKYNGVDVEVRGKLTADDIQSGGTITGSTFQTKADPGTGNRSRFIVSASDNYARFYNSSNSNVITIGSASDYDSAPGFMGVDAGSSIGIIGDASTGTVAKFYSSGYGLRISSRASATSGFGEIFNGTAHLVLRPGTGVPNWTAERGSIYVMGGNTSQLGHNPLKVYINVDGGTDWRVLFDSVT